MHGPTLERLEEARPHRGLSGPAMLQVSSYWTFSDVFEAGKGQAEAEAAAPAAGSAAKADGGSGSIG